MGSNEDLIDCDHCHITWDGNAQCTCDGAMGLLEAVPEVKDKFITKVLPSGEVMVAILISFHYGNGWSSSQRTKNTKKYYFITLNWFNTLWIVKVVQRLLQ